MGARSFLLVGLLLVPLTAQADELSLSFDTKTANGKYAPRNIVAVWVEDGQGAFVKTIGRWSATRTSHLVNWIAASGQDNDAVSGATRSNHNNRLTASWDLSGAPNGTYTLKVELCENNTSAGNPGQNPVASFTFDVDGNYRSEMGLAASNVLNATIDYIPGASDGGGSPNGSTEFACPADGVCDSTCVDVDPDCAPSDGSDPTGSSTKAIQGGCATTSANSSPLAFVALLFLAMRRRRRTP